MGRNRVRTWWLLVVIVAFVAVGAAAGSAGTASHVGGHVAALTDQASSGGVLEAVLRTEADRVDSVLASKSAFTGRLLLLLSVAVAGLALLSDLAAGRRGARLVEAPPQRALLRAWLGLRGPPSSLLVSVPD